MLRNCIAYSQLACLTSPRPCIACSTLFPSELIKSEQQARELGSHIVLNALFKGHYCIAAIQIAAHNIPARMRNVAMSLLPLKMNSINCLVKY